MRQVHAAQSDLEPSAPRAAIADDLDPVLDRDLLSGRVAGDQPGSMPPLGQPVAQVVDEALRAAPHLRPVAGVQHVYGEPV